MTQSELGKQRCENALTFWIAYQLVHRIKNISTAEFMFSGSDNQLRLLGMLYHVTGS